MINIIGKKPKSFFYHRLKFWEVAYTVYENKTVVKSLTSLFRTSQKSGWELSRLLNLILAFNGREPAILFIRVSGLSLTQTDLMVHLIL